MPYDVCAIRLIKSTGANPLSSEKSAGLVSLGHFDFMNIERLKSSEVINPLELIQADRSSVGESMFNCNINQVYTLYILRQITESDLKHIDSFWNDPTVFTVVTRIHCKYPSRGTKHHLTKQLQEYCSSQTGLYSRVILQEVNAEVIQIKASYDGKAQHLSQVSCLFYDSLELSDSVAVIKGNSLASIMEVVQFLSLESSVKDTYTYCGIDRQLLQDGTRRIINMIPAGARLAYFETRFSVRNRNNAELYFGQLKGESPKKNLESYVTGTADRIICWEDASEENLINIVRKMIVLSPSSHLCFNDIITRVGILPEPVDIPKPECALLAHLNPHNYVKPRQGFKPTEEIKHYLLEKQREASAPSWIYSMLKLLGTLESMQENYVMDDLAALIVPGVEALLERIQYLLSLDGEIRGQYNSEILRFLNSWVDLTHDVSQLESQLTQHPELSPVRCYIPATLLRFEKCFMEKCGNLLLDRNSDRKFVPMLIPFAERDLYTTAPLDPRQETYIGKSPLAVYIPIRAFYDPWRCAHHMAHEVAHYSGDNARLRSTRYEAICECIAWFLAGGWLQKFRECARSSDDTSIKNGVSYLKDCIIKKSKLYLGGTEYYLRQTMEALYFVRVATINELRYCETFLYSVNPEYFYLHSSSYLQGIQDETHMNYLTALDEKYSLHLTSLKYVAAECYADLAMILLLDSTFESYYSCLYDEEYAYQSQNHCSGVVSPPFNQEVVLHIQRMALVIACSQDEKDNSILGEWNIEDILEGNRATKPWAAWAAAMAQAILSPEGKTHKGINMQEMLRRWQTEDERVLSLEELKVMAKYLSKCADELNNQLKKKRVEKSELIKVLSYLRNEQGNDKDILMWDQLQEYLLQNSM